MKLGILLTGHPPEQLSADGRYDAYFQRLLGEDSFDYVTYSVVDGAFPDSPQDCDGWLITGSKHGAYEDHPWIAPLEEFIRACYATRVPMVGICFGHQIIAQAMGGRVEKFAGGWSVGRVVYEIEGQAQAINAWHQDQVTEKPAGAKVIGQTDFCAYAALLYDDLFWTVQPHPEFEPDYVGNLIEMRGRGVVPDAQLEAAKAQLDAPLDNKAIARRMTQFLKQERS